MKIASYGFADFDRQLLERQLKIVTGHTAVDWEYIGDAMLHEADVFIARVVDAVSARLLEEMLAGYEGIVATCGHNASIAGAMQLEWPLRVFSLLTLLDRAEAQAGAGSAADAPVCEQIAALTSTHWIDLGGWVLVIRPESGMILGHGGSFDLAVQQLLRGKLQLHHDMAPVKAAAWCSSLERLIWSLALHCQRIPRNWSVTATRFRVGSYPHYEEWEVSPQLLRLAALFTRHSETISGAAHKTSLTTDQVQAFLYACELCQLGLSRQQQAPAPARAEVVPVGGISGFLGQLRKRLGLAFH